MPKIYFSSSIQKVNFFKRFISKVALSGKWTGYGVAEQYRGDRSTANIIVFSDLREERDNVFNNSDSDN